MKTSKGFVIGALIGCGALAAYVVVSHAAPSGGATSGTSGASRAARAATLPALGCDLHPGSRLGFSLRQRSSYTVSAQQVLGADAARSGGARPAREARVVSGELLLRVLDDAPQDGALTVAAVLEDPRVAVSGARAGDVEAELEKPVLFRVDRACKIVGFAPGAPLRAATANLWKLTLKMAETVIPAPGTARAWKVEQSDATGTFVASYARKDRDGAAELRRTRGPYRALHQDAGGAVTADVLRSEVVAHARPGQAWIEDLRVDEHVVLKSNGATMADVETTLSLAGRDVAEHAGGFWTRALSGVGLAFGSVDALEQPPPRLPYADRKPIEGLRDRSPSTVLADVAARLALKPQADFDAALDLLVQYLRLDPKNARAVAEQIRRGDGDDGTRSVLWLGLSLAGGKEAHAVLAEALGDRRLAEGDRLRALAALAGVPDPDRAVTDALLGARDGALALGTLAHNPAVSVEERSRIMGALAADLSRASTPEAQITALTALGNAGDGALRDSVAALAGSDDPRVSAAAYRALKKMGGLPPSGELLEAFAASTDGRQQSALAEALGGVKLDDAGVARAAAMLQHEPRAGVRATLVSLLGAVAASNPAAKDALVAQFRIEKEPAILSLLGRFLKPSDLN